MHVESDEHIKSAIKIILFNKSLKICDDWFQSQLPDGHINAKYCWSA